MTLLQQLLALPDDWGLVAVDGQKRAYQTAWQKNPLTKNQVAYQIQQGAAKAVGVIAGPPSGLLFVDHDGISASTKLEELGLPLRELPKSPAMTSGKDGRFQLIFRVPPQFWSSLRGQRIFKTGKLDSDGKAEQLDLRWAGHYSVVIGAHPETSGYRWIRERSPDDLPIADAPLALIELLLNIPKPPPAPLLAPLSQSLPCSVPFLDFVTQDSRILIETGGTPGSWNDDQLRMTLDLKGTETWLLAQGMQLDITAKDAFERHVAAARNKAANFDQHKAWQRFYGAEARNPSAGTPEEKLLQRLAYHTRTTRHSLPTASIPTEVHQTAKATAPAVSKPTKLETIELLAMLREQATGGRIRFNRYSQQVEIDGAVIEGAERFYLNIAEQGFKVSKDLAFDCLIQVARENPYDPVLLYLEHVAATVQPAYINGLATGYLRPEDDDGSGSQSLYDHMLRCTLIGAVRRVFEPGCKHDTACVLMGDQGARKSSFWSALGGAFFSDALRDISNKDDLMVLHHSWIMEWAELDHIMGRKHAGQIKSFLSQATDLFRVPYGKSTEAFPRRSIIVGSTNRQTGFLQDDTGNRRFWVIPTTRTEAEPIDTPTLMAERDAIWSGAVHAYRAGEANYLPAELAAQVSSENDGYRVENPWLPAVQHWLSIHGIGGQVTSERILLEAIQKPIERQTRADQMAVADILTSLGYVQRRISQSGGRVRVWAAD